MIRRLGVLGMVEASKTPSEASLERATLKTKESKHHYTFMFMDCKDSIGGILNEHTPPD